MSHQDYLNLESIQPEGLILSESWWDDPAPEDKSPKRSSRPQLQNEPYISLTEKDIFKMEYWPLELAKIKSSSLRLKGSVTVITGGLGSLGYATAQKFKKEGSEVAIIDIVNPKKTSLNLEGISYFKFDITTEEEVKKAYEAIINKFGGVDILISNAGFAIQGSLQELSKSQLDKSFDINLFAHHFETDETIPESLIKKIKDSKNFGMATMYIRQLVFGYLDIKSPLKYIIQL